VIRWCYQLGKEPAFLRKKKILRLPLINNTVSKCDECGRLALIHAEMIRAHVEELARYPEAKRQRDQTAISSLEPMLRQAAE
jgi:hypothetical protein